MEVELQTKLAMFNLRRARPGRTPCLHGSPQDRSPRRPLRRPHVADEEPGRVHLLAGPGLDGQATCQAIAIVQEPHRPRGSWPEPGARPRQAQQHTSPVRAALTARRSSVAAAPHVARA